MEIARGRAGESSWEVAWATPGTDTGPGVIGYHGFRLNLGRLRRRLELPAANATLVVLFGGGESDDGPHSRGTTALEPLRALLCGPQTRTHAGEHSGRLYGVDVTMRPWAAYALFGVPMHELADRAVDLADVIGARQADLPRRLAEAADWPGRFAVLDEVLAGLRARGPEASPQVVRALRELGRAGGAVPIARLAGELDWDMRRLQRAFAAQVGVSPKVAARVLRLRRVLRLLDAGLPLSRVAHECAYFDQAHLTRDFAEMTGRSPRRFLAERAAMPAGPPDIDRLAGQVTSIVPDPGRPGRRVGFLQDSTLTIRDSDGARWEAEPARG